MIKVRGADLNGPALSWAIESVEGVDQPETGQLQLSFCPGLIDDSLGEKLIAKYGVWIERGAHVNWLADMKNDPFERQTGETRVIAACRAIVAAKFGDTVRIPAEFV
ncbi:MAG: hypothetical protein ACOH2O_11390 [Pseudomonas sp.]